MPDQPLTSERIAELRRALAKITPGVWKSWGATLMADHVGDSDVEKATPVATFHTTSASGRLTTTDMEAVRLLMAAAPALLAEQDQERLRASARPPNEPSKWRYRKKPVMIEAYQFSNRIGHDVPRWLEDAVAAETVSIQNTNHIPHAIIYTLEGDMRADIGDWIIKGVKGELYPCKPDIFSATYDPALDGSQPAGEPHEGPSGPSGLKSPADALAEALEEAIDFADQDHMALTAVGQSMVTRWGRALADYRAGKAVS